MEVVPLAKGACQNDDAGDETQPLSHCDVDQSGNKNEGFVPKTCCTLRLEAFQAFYIYKANEKTYAIR
jgi:hypothetical protein